MKPVFVALTAAGVETACRARSLLGGEVHVAQGLDLLPLWEKAPSGSAGGRMRGAQARRSPTPHPPLRQAKGHPLPQGERADAKSFHVDRLFTATATHLRTLFSAGTPIVGVCAAGILIRILAPLLSDKRDEPPVIAMSEDGAEIVPLLGGHRGANALAQNLAEALGGHAAITTAGDRRFGIALDAPPAGWTLANPGHAKPVMAALLAGAAARLDGDCAWLSASALPFSPNGEIRLVATTRSMTGDDRTLVYHPRRLVVGLGCERGVTPAEAIELVQQSLDATGLAAASIACIASIDVKADEAAILEAARHFGVPARFFPAAALEAETPRLKNPSELVFREVGCHGVAEGAALAAVGPAGKLVLEKRKSARATCAIAEAPDILDPHKIGRARGRLAIVGIGPGAAAWLTPEARDLIASSDAFIGYSLYLDLIAGLIGDAERFDSALGSEEERVRLALKLAGEGRSVALVSSGDPGIYAMAALAFECLDADRTFSHREKVVAKRPDEGVQRRPQTVVMPGLDPGIHSVTFALDHDRYGMDGRVKPCHDDKEGDDIASSLRLSLRTPFRAEIVVSPGISAMQAASARSGAPLGHDFCAISLSDLLTPWETIEARIEAAAAADFVIAFYNPVSQRRREQLGRAKAILLRHRSADTPVVLARNLGRDGENITTIRLADLDVAMVDMLTLVLVGASTTRQVRAAGRTWIYTPRGYGKKRNADAAE